MDLGTLSISASILLVCTLPFVIMYKKKVNRQHAIADGLIQIAGATNCTLTKKDVYGDFAIGLDEAANYAFYFKRNAQETISHSIDLSQMNRCEVKATHSPFDPKNPQDNEIDRLDLTFYPTSKQDELISLNFYDVDDSFQLADELPLIEKWASILNKQIK